MTAMKTDAGLSPPTALSMVPKPIAWRIKWPKGAPGTLDGFGLTDSWELAEARQRQGATLTPLYEQAALATATPTARAQAAAETPFATGIHTASREIASDVDTVADEKAPEKIAAIITKHLGAGAGLTLTEEERRDFRWALDDMKYNGRTAIAGRLEGLYLRLTPGEANHG